MIDCARIDAAMYGPVATDPVALDRFQVFNKNWTTSYTYDYYSTPAYDTYLEPEIDSSTNVYHTLVSREYMPRDEWQNKIVDDWTEEDTMSWYVEIIRNLGFNEYDWPPSKFRIPGIALRGLTQDQVIERMANPTFDISVSKKLGEKIFEKIRLLLCAYLDSSAYQRPTHPTMLDLDTFDNRQRTSSIYDYSQEPYPQLATDSSSNDAEDYYRNADSASPEYYGSDASKSEDEMEDKRKIVKRPPGRPKGSGKKSISKRPRSVSVPEFLKNLVLDPKYCPSIIRWEDYSRGMFRFMKPDEVARLWGTLKQNENMNFEKFSRAMRYHYRNNVLVSVPTQRLVYQFGPKGPNYKTDNPNFLKPE